MKKAFAIIAILTLFLLSVGCGSDKEPLNKDIDGSANVESKSSESSVESTPPPSPISAEKAAPQENKEESTGDTTNTEKASSPDNSKKSGSQVIAQSDNAVSNEDKEAVLRELEKELDSLFSSINELEDIEDSDMSLD